MHRLTLCCLLLSLAPATAQGAPPAAPGAVETHGEALQAPPPPPPPPPAQPPPPPPITPAPALPPPVILRPTPPAPVHAPPPSAPKIIIVEEKPATSVPIIIKKVDPSATTTVETAPPSAQGIPTPEGRVEVPTTVTARPRAQISWDYVCVAFETNTMTRLLNEAGSRGWELVSVGPLETQDVLCFRRPRGV